ncbi:MAG TPA: type I 3-dehydroquinate dehydratase [Planctomycetaceae bacterium]|nr:type I 3-dehydroquinate dehydratase [Planctomycetaceae bacterium]
MICISVTPESRRLAKADLLNASRQGDLIELCLDHLVRSPDIADLIEAVDKPILVTCRRSQDGGQWTGDETERLQLLRQAIVAEPEWIELDLDIAKKVPRYGRTKRVVAHTSLYESLGATRSEIDSVFDAARDADADVVKFTWPTPTLEAAWPLLSTVSQKRDLPVVGMGLGPCGLTFSLLARKYGSPWIYAALERGMEAYEGQPTVGDLDEIHRWRSISNKTHFIGFDGFDSGTMELIGLFNHAAEMAGLDARWLPLAWSDTGRLKQMLEVLKVGGVVGRSGGDERLGELAESREEALGVDGPVDLLMNRDGAWRGFGCLWRAALRTLESQQEGSGDRPLDRRNVLVFGSGALARTMIFGVTRRKGLVSVAGSNEKETRQLAADTGVRFIPAQNLYDTLVDIVVLADPDLQLGPGRGQLNPAFLRPPMQVIDVAAGDEDTEVLAEARARGCCVVEPSVVRRNLAEGLFRSITGQDLPADNHDG